MKKIKNSTFSTITIAIVLILFCIFTCALGASAQTYNRNGNTFEQVSTRTSSTGTKTSYTFKDSKGNEYPIFITKTGRCYVMKVSSKTGKEYKYYLKEDLSREIAREMNITYIEPKKKTN